MRRVLLPVLAVAMVVAGWAHVAAAAEGTTSTVLVHLAGSQGSGALEHVLGELDRADAEPTAVDAYDTFPWAAVEVDGDGKAVLERSAAVLDVEPVHEHALALDQAVPKVKGDVLTTAGFDGTGQAVAVLDTGVQTDHPFLAGRTVAEACFSGAYRSCPGGVSSSTGTGSGVPCTFSTSCDHGTHVAGIALGRQPASTPSAPTQGMAPGASLVAVRIFSHASSSGSVLASDSDILAGLDWVSQQAATLHVASVNLSLGGDPYHGPCDAISGASAYVSAFASLITNGVAPVVAAGNDGGDGVVTEPGCVSNAISVAATKASNDHLAYFSNTATFADLSAPGYSIRSSVTGSGYGTKSGTSMATPMVAGAFAALKHALPTATVAQLLGALQATGAPVVTRDLLSGGAATVVAPNRIDVQAALTSLLAVPSPPTALVASVGDQAISLTWSPPRWSGAHAVSGYRVTVTGEPGLSQDVTTASADLTGLTNGTTYAISVVARSSDGSSAAAQVSAAPATIPATPTAVTATPGNGRATVTWTAPTDTGTVPLTGYKVTTTPGATVTTASGTSVVVTGLTNGTAYSFKVQSLNPAGASVASAASTPVTPLATVPGPPTAVTAVAGINVATVSWTAPADDGGAGPLGYTVLATPDVGPVGVAGATSAVVANLVAGTSYTFTVTASNSVGRSAASTASAAVVPVAPSPGGGGGGGGGGAGGGGGGGGGGGVITTTSTSTTTSTTSTTVRPAPTTTTTTVPPASPPPTPAVSVPGGVVAVRDGVPVKLPVSVPSGVTVAAAAATPSGKGAWVVTAQGKVLTAGDAPTLGSIKGSLNKPIVGMASTASGKGYWLLGSDGGVFSFGDAHFHGSTGSRKLNQPITTLASTASGKGYWLLAADGGVFTFGDARFLGSTGGRKLDAPVVSLATTPTGKGYWLVGQGGAVFAYGDAANVGSGGKGKRIVALAPTASGKGYWLLAADGSAIPYGDAVKR